MRIYILLFCTTIFGFSSNDILSQDTKIVITEDCLVTIDQIFRIISEQSEYNFIYQSDLFSDYQKVKIKKGTIKVNKLLKQSLSTEDFIFELTSNSVIKIKEKPIDTIQKLSITGKITDDNKVPLVGVTILIKGTQTGVSSSFDGDYTIKIPAGLKNIVLVYSYIGYTTQEITIETQSTIDLVMVPDLSDLDEVVVVGYGTVKKKDLTGAVSSLSKGIIESSNSTTIGSMIQGQLPGVRVLTGSSSPGTPIRIRIRGDATITSGADPLIVIDGVPMPQDYNLNDINPDDIKSLDVLKGASASAIYGSRASAGVLEITTKRGTKYTKPQIIYNSNLGYKFLENDIRALNGNQFKSLYEEGLINYIKARFDLRGDNEEAKSFVRQSNNLNYYNYFLPDDKFGSSNTNWVDLMIGNTFTKNHHLSLRGGDETTQYSFAFGKTIEDGMLVGSDFERNSLSMNFDQKFSENVKMGFSFLGGSSDRNGTVDISSATKMRPDIPAYNDDGSFHVFTYEWFGTRQIDNPLLIGNDVTNNTIGKTLSLSPYAEFKLFNDFKFTTRYNYNLSTSEQEVYYPRTTRLGQNYSDAKGTLSHTQSENNSTTFTNHLSYLKEFGNHDISAVLGMEFNERTSKYVTERYMNFADDKVQNAIWQAADYRWSNGDKSKTSAVGYFGRINYRFMDRFLLTSAFRVDGSSRFSPKNRYGIFPSVAVGYIISEESFFQPLKKTINLLKLRASTGKTGNDRVGAYSWLAQYQSGIDYMNQPGVRPVDLGNDNLKWESSTEYNLGLDFGFMANNRIRGSIDIYKKNVKNMLIGIPMSPSTGVNSVVQNFGDMTNSGIELGLSGVVIQKGDFTWDLGVNISKNKNILTKLGIDRASTTSGATWLSYFVIEEGQPLGLIYGYKTDGLFQNWDEVDEYNALNSDGKYQEPYGSNTAPGDIKFVDTSGNGLVRSGSGKDDDLNEDRRIIGKTQPDFWGGLSTTFQYKRLRLDVRGTFQKGGVKYWKYGESNFQMGLTSPGNVDGIALERWTPENPNAKYPSFRNQYYTNKISDFWLYDASFLKIQEINISYYLPKKILEKTKFITRLNIYASINNVHTFTKYPGYNVESFSSNPIQGSIMDYSSYPNERTFKLGVKVTF